MTVGKLIEQTRSEDIAKGTTVISNSIVLPSKDASVIKVLLATNQVIWNLNVKKAHILDGKVQGNPPELEVPNVLVTGWDEDGRYKIHAELHIPEEERSEV